MLFSRLPWKILYFFSDLFFYLNYYIIGYRKKVVINNLKMAFPEKNDIEINEISKKFFKNFGDFLVETIKIFSITEKDIKKTVNFINIEAFAKARKQKKNVILLSGHCFNWEMASSIGNLVPQKNLFAIYKKLNDDFWDEKIVDSRGKFGSKLLETASAMHTIKKNENDGESAYVFLADQSPYYSKIKTGITFLGLKTPVFTGFDRIDNKNEMMILFADITKIKRNLYQIEFKEITADNNQEFQPFEIVKKFYQILESSIKNHPENWLWTHKRWKYADYVTDEMMI